MFDNVKRFARSQDVSLAVDAARLGDELREAREAMGASVEDMSRQLRIRRVYLVALEEGRLKDLPSAAYALGFVRNYAGALGLDATDMVRRFRDAAMGQAARRTDLVFPEPVPERGFPAGVTTLAGLAILVVAYVAWYNWSGSGSRTVDAVPPVPARLEPAARDGEAMRPQPGPAPAPVAQAPAAQLPAAPVQATPSLPPLPTPTPVPVQVPAPPAPPAAAAPPADAARIVLRFRADAWTQVRDPRTGQQLLNRVMRAGESFTVPNREGLLLSTGVAQAMDVLVDGVPSPVLAGWTGVRRDIPLVPDQLRAAPAPRPAANGAPAAAPPPPAQVGPAPRPATPAAPPPRQ
ncbi:helix-turn-helix domain-containing protein [Roseococcus sp. DSY-14]|uniref:helix-turn-helix domain-containing protein n=1 Tax=Roseococcus sp. DSY-14 TaxID=3369650 RepID=UPI00387B5B4F